MTLLGLLTLWAVAAEPNEEAAEEDVVEESEHIVVYGELRVEEARQQVIQELTAQGFVRVKEKDGRTVLKHLQNWKGKAVLHDDGRIEFKRNSPEGTMPDTFFKEASPLIGWVPCVVVPTACVKVGGWVVSKRKLGGLQQRSHSAVQPSIDELSVRQADLAIDRKLEALDARLVDCWERGVPLEGTEPLPSPEARRRHLLAYWRSRTDTIWGDRMREPVAAYLRHVVQDSEHPVTTTELAQANAGKDASRQLELPNVHPTQ